MKVLITGGTGFIGQHLILKCVQLGWETHVLLRPNSTLSPLIPQEKISVHLVDGTTDTLIKIFNAIKVDGVFHLASYFCAEHKTEDIPGLIESNLLFGTQLLEAMTKTQTKFLVNTGTSWQHFNNENYNPVSLYAATKQAFVDVLTFFTETKKISAITLKLFDTFGPGDQRKKLFPFLLSQAKKTVEKEPLPPLELSPGDQQINFLYIDDVVSAYISAIELLIKNPAITHLNFAIASPETLSLKEFIHFFQKTIQVSFPLAFGKKPYREREVMTLWNSGKSLPGWAPQVSLKEGIELTWQQYTRQGK